MKRAFRGIFQYYLAQASGIQNEETSLMQLQSSKNSANQVLLIINNQTLYSQYYFANKPLCKTKERAKLSYF